MITEGRVQAGAAVTLTREGPDRLSVADADALLHLPDRDPAKLHKALNILALSPGGQQSFRDLAAPEQPAQKPGRPGGSTQRLSPICKICRSLLAAPRRQPE